MPETTDADERTTQSKKPYSTPTLVEYGDIAKLTQGRPSGRFPDGMSAMFRPTSMCL
jgi:hypothetical protein